MTSMILAAMLALVLTCILSPLSIRMLAKLRVGQPILGYVDNHIDKQGTPTMGGVIFLLAFFVSVLSLFKGEASMTAVVCAAVFGYGTIGFLDDFIKVRYRHNKGLAAYQKIIAQLGLAILLSVYCYRSQLIGGTIVLPFTGTSVEIGFWIIPLAIVVLLGFTNSVNLTDGLDGLASMTTVAYLLPTLALTAWSLSLGQANGAGAAVLQEWQNLLVAGGALLGAVLGFLLFNANPAKIFMGDTGSLAIGGGLAMLALCTKSVLLIPMIGIMFVWSSISVIVQVTVFKLTKKRVFLMAPFHHHLERKGWSETRIGILYAAITLFVGCAVVLATIYFGGGYGAG